MKRQLRTRRTVRRRSLSPAEKRRIAAARAYFQGKKPSLTRLLRDGDALSAMPWGEYLELLDVFKALQALRKSKGISLAALARQTGIDKAALSRLESGAQGNPTVATICRYAAALGASVRIVIDRRGGAA